MSKLLHVLILVLITGFGGSVMAQDAKRVNPVKSEINVLKVYPNPFAESVKIEFTSKCECDYTLVMTDVSGRAVLKDKFTANAGTVYKTIGQLSEFPHGTYTISIANGHDASLSTRLVH